MAVIHQFRAAAEAAVDCCCRNAAGSAGLINGIPTDVPRIDLNLVAQNAVRNCFNQIRPDRTDTAPSLDIGVEEREMTRPDAIEIKSHRVGSGHVRSLGARLTQFPLMTTSSYNVPLQLTIAAWMHGMTIL